MAHLLRLIFGALLLVGSVSNAAVPQWPVAYRATAVAPVVWHATLNNACAAGKVFAQGVYPNATLTELWCVWDDGEGSVRWSLVPDPGYAVQYTIERVVNICPTNSSAAGSACTCNSGFSESAGSCVVPASDLQEYCKKISKNPVPLRVRSSSINALGQVCEVPFFSVPGIPAGHGCVSTLGSGIKTTDEDGVSWTQAEGIASEATCTGPLAGTGTGPSAEPVKDPCPNGYAGTVNGSTVCAQHDPNNGIEWAGTKTTTNANGTKVEVKDVTSCTGGQCTTTTTTKNIAANGSVTSTSTVTTKDTIAGTCSAKPSNGVCAATGVGNGSENGGSSFGGDCASGFKAVSDDAVINAMAEETFRQNCKVNPDTDSQTLAKAEAAKTGNQTGDNPNNGEGNVGPSSFDTSDAIGGGASCIADKSVTIAGSSFLLPLSLVCDSLGALGMVLLACSFLLAGRIVTRG